VDETRLEMVVPDDRLADVEEALRAAHPYEEPAFDFVLLRETGAGPIGRVGDLAAAASFQEFIQTTGQALGSTCWLGDRGHRPQSRGRGGAGDDEWEAARVFRCRRAGHGRGQAPQCRRGRPSRSAWSRPGTMRRSNLASRLWPCGWARP